MPLEAEKPKRAGSKSPRTKKKKGKKGPVSLREQLPSLTGTEMKKLAIKHCLAWHPGTLMSDPDAVDAVLASEGDALKKLVVQKMGLDECSTDMRAATELDYYLCAVWVTKENKFTPQEASGSFTLLANLFANLKTERMGLRDNIKYFKEQLSIHTAEEEEYNRADSLSSFKGTIHDFQPRSSKILVDFVNTGLFQHYRMYSFLCHGTRPQEVEQRVIGFTIPPAPVPLDEARSRNERLKLEAEAHLATVRLPPPPPELSPEDAAAITAEVVEEVFWGQEEQGQPLGDTGLLTDGKTEFRPLSAHMKEAEMDDTNVKAQVSEHAMAMAEKLVQQVQEEEK